MKNFARAAPFKGGCSYYSLANGDERSVNAVWTYEAPFAAVAAIKDHLAFYPDFVTISGGSIELNQRANN